MIKLNAMRIPCILTVFLTLAFFFSPGSGSAQSLPDKPVIIAPRPGEAILGNVEINGITELAGFSRTEVDFRYTNDPRDTWFLISETDQTVNPGIITDWDTTAITDGIYDLRVTVFLTNGEAKSSIISGLRVRNYSPVETSTPSVSDATGQQNVTEVPISPTRTPRPTARVLPENNAVFTTNDLINSLLRGTTVGIGFFIAFAVYWIVKKSLSE